jgi:ribosomal protein S18 acetylase RimI-like enzyme
VVHLEDRTTAAAVIKRFSLRSAAYPETLRTIDASDLDDLRQWKNTNTAAFFFKDEITREAQAKWFEAYLARADDFMFLVESQGLRAGCMGVRIEDGVADGYNVIGAPGAQGRGIFGRAMRLMCSYVLTEHTRQISCRVIKGNPAVAWYQKCGYRIVVERADHFEMALDLSCFAPCTYIRQPE